MAAPRYIAKKVGNRFVLERQPDSNDWPAGTCALIGAVISISALRRGGLLGHAALIAGAAMLYRGATGNNPLESLFRYQPAREPRRQANLSPSFQHDDQARATQLPADEIDEAAMESFPASDPPARHVKAPS